MRNSISLSAETETKAEAAHQAWGVLRKTFYQWTVIGAGVVALRERADDLGGRNTFKRLLEQQGLGALAKAKAVTSRLEKIMAHLPEVMAWHQRLDEKQQIDWGSPSSVIRHCPVFQTEKKTSSNARAPAIAKPENLAKVMEQQEARIEELEQEIATLRESGAPAAPTLTTVEGDENLQCSFCRKTAQVVKHLIRTDDDVTICDECVALCVEIVGKQEAAKLKRAAATPAKARRQRAKPAPAVPA